MKVRCGVFQILWFSHSDSEKTSSPHHHVYNQQFPQVDFAQELPILNAWGTDRPPRFFHCALKSFTPLVVWIRPLTILTEESLCLSVYYIQYIACIFTLYSAVRWTFLALPTVGSGTVLVVLTVVVTSSTTSSTYQYEHADPHLIHDARVYMMRSSYSSRLVKFHLRSFMLNHSCFDGQDTKTIGSDIHPATRKWHGHKRKKAATVYVVCGTT